MRLLLIGMLLCGLFISSAEEEPGNRAKQIDSLFDAGVSAGSPGAGVLVIQNGKKIFEKGYGVSDLRSMRKIDAQTNFRLASVTKQFTATAIMLLVRDGKLHYDDRLTNLLPGFPDYGKSITLRNLLNHTSGLVDYEDLMEPAPGEPPRYDRDRHQIKDAGVVSLLEQQTKTKFPPGKSWSYSNSGYAVLAMIVERTSGIPFGQFLHDRIFAPLGMTNTVAFEKGKNEVANRAYGHTPKGAAWEETDQSPTSAVLGDGGIYSSLADLEKWDRALSRHTLLTAAEMQPALTPVKVQDGSVRGPDGSPAEYGFGWFLNSYQGRARMWHYGETVGFRTAIERFPHDKLTVIVLCNRSDLIAHYLALQVADLYVTRQR